MAWTLVVAASGSVAASLVYMAVGATLLRRDVSPAHRAGALAFVIWWLALAGSTALAGARLLLAVSGVRDPALYAVTSDVSLLVLCLGLGALLYHLLYLYTGRAGLWRPLLVFYLLYAFTLLYYVERLDPTGIEVSRWGVRPVYAVEPVRGVFFEVLLALLVLPQVAAAVAYFLLYFRVQDRALRFRIATVSWSIIIWFLSSYVVAAADLAQTDAWQVASRLIGLAAALAVLVAYRPPAWLRRRLDAPRATAVRRAVATGRP